MPPQALTAGETNLHPKWKSPNNDNSTDPTCCYEQVLNAFKNSNLSKVSKKEKVTNCNIFKISQILI